MSKELIKKRLNEYYHYSLKKSIAVGALIKCVKTGRVFLLLRNDPKPIWSLMSGGVDDGESPINALKREMKEELFIDSSSIKFISKGVEHFIDKNREFHYFEGFSENDFTPVLDHENLNFVWTDLNHLPSPLYKGLLEKIENISKSEK